jgi:AcrR family transcriptional regulator
VPRWEPHAQDRLEQAALELYSERGYDETTVSDIAARVGVTSRTYFRYFPDKREVLFGGADKLRDCLTAAVREAAPDLPPLAAAFHGMAATEHLFHDRQYLCRREAVIGSSPELQEREAMKHASLAAVLAAVLGERGTDASTARLVADAAVAVYLQSVRLWMDDADTPYPQLLERAALQLEDTLAARAGQA